VGTGASFVVRRDAFADCRVDDQPPPRAADGEVVVQIASFGLSSNNITYAATGDTLGYWRFFPARGEWGSIPVWGFARVAESGHPEISSGVRLYGFFPPATHTVLRPGRCSPAGFMESSPHRTSLPGAYNWYEVAGSDPAYDADTEAEQMLLRPLFFTSFLLADLVEEQEAGPRPAFFFAPDRIRQRTGDWGRDGLAQRVATAWADYLRWVQTWLQVTRVSGLDGLQGIYPDVLAGAVDPAQGHIVEL
jgi:hypothetical protein